MHVYHALWIKEPIEYALTRALTVCPRDATFLTGQKVAPVEIQTSQFPVMLSDRVANISGSLLAFRVGCDSDCDCGFYARKPPGLDVNFNE
jgi:hypothetical protein